MPEVNGTKFTQHSSGQFCKKVNGRIIYFGTDLTEAFARWEREKADLLAGRSPRPEAGGVISVLHVVNAFLEHKEQTVQSGELSPLTWHGYKVACDHIIEAFGKSRYATSLTPHDFAKLRQYLAKPSGPYGPARLAVVIQYVRSVFKYAFETELLDKQVRFGPTFKGPSKKTMRIHRAGKAQRVFEAEELRRALDVANPQLRAMILLGVNCAFNNSDVGHLPMSSLDLSSGWIEFARVKTGVGRRCPLWPETIEAIQAWLAVRPAPKRDEHASLVFLTRYGGSWAKNTLDSPLSREMTGLLKQAGVVINGRGSFGTLRHVFRTVADESKDQIAVDSIMGHASEHVSGYYRERISDRRLQAVVQYVRAWLFESA
jgi:integrase